MTDNLPHPSPLASDPLDDSTLDGLPDNQLRERLIKQTKARTGLTPRDFQLDTAVALWRNRDVVLVAGTGSGKTLPFVMPCFLSKHVVVVIVSPLNALQDDQVRRSFCRDFTNDNILQARRFREWGLHATTINATALSNNKCLLKVRFLG